MEPVWIRREVALVLSGDGRFAQDAGNQRHELRRNSRGAAVTSPPMRHLERRAAVPATGTGYRAESGNGASPVENPRREIFPR
jgi:hypothetical protein